MLELATLRYIFLSKPVPNRVNLGICKWLLLKMIVPFTWNTDWCAAWIFSAQGIKVWKFTSCLWEWYLKSYNTILIEYVMAGLSICLLIPYFLSFEAKFSLLSINQLLKLDLLSSSQMNLLKSFIFIFLKVQLTKFFNNFQYSHIPTVGQNKFQSKVVIL